MSAVWDQSQAEGGTLLVLLALADFSDHEGTSWPSIPVLAKKSRLSERQVQYALQSLRRMGELRVVRHGAPVGRPDRKANRYEVQLLHPVAERGAMDGTNGVQSAASTGCNPLHPNRQGDPSVEPSGGRQRGWRTLPAGEELTEARKAKAVGLSLPAHQVAGEWEKLKAHDFVRPKLRVDATWENWVRHAVEDLRRRKILPPRGAAPPPGKRALFKAEPEWTQNYHQQLRQLAGGIGRKIL